MSPRSAFLKKYRSIVLQRTLYQLQFWRRHINILYNATYIHISVNSAVELLSRDTALVHNHKSTLFASALPVKRFLHAVVRHALFSEHIHPKRPFFNNKDKIMTKIFYLHPLWPKYQSSFFIFCYLKRLSL